MHKFRKKPVVIEAVRFDTNANDETVSNPKWFVDAMVNGKIFYQGGETPYLTIPTLEGDMRANEGDWIIQGVKGELYPCKPDIFAATYEPA